jgi:hypothetical protein
MPAPIYFSETPPAAIADVRIQPQALPNFTGVRFGEVLTAGAEFVGALAAGQAETRKAKATSGYLTELAALEDSYAQDPDYQNAPLRFDAAASELRAKYLNDAKLGAADQAQLDLTFNRMQVSSAGGVKAKALAREAADNAAALDGLQLTLSRQAAASGSPTERAAYTAQFEERVGGAVRSGWIPATAGENYLQKFRSTLDEADILAGIQTNPAAIAAALDQPDSFASLDPVTRARYRAIAAGEADQAGIDALGFTAETNPAAAMLTLNRIIDPKVATDVFDRGIIVQESGGDAGAVSPKGALGVSQVMPETARDMARLLGRKDIAALGDADLKKTLLADPLLNRQLGLAYWNQQLERFDGNAALALAAYNAGPANADRWQAKAIAEFGADFTPAELVSVISYGETQDYVMKVFGHVGADIAGAGLTPHGRARAWSAVETATAGANNERLKAIRDMAALERDATDPLDMIKAGLRVDDGTTAAYIATQRQAAAAGDREAAKEVQRAETMLAMKPIVDEAWTQPVTETRAMLQAAETALADNPSPELADRVAVLREVTDEIEKKRNDDPIALGVRAGRFREVTLDPNAPANDRGFANALLYRGNQAIDAAAHFGGKVLPFHPAEASAIKDRLAKAPEGEKLAVLTTMAGAMSKPAFRAAIGQLELDPLTEAAAIFGVERPGLARQILHGAELLKSEGVAKPAKELREALGNAVGGELWPDPQMLDAVASAATAVYVAARGGNASLFDADDAGALEEAIEAVTGPIVSRNGVKVPAPPSMTADAFEARLDALTDQDLDRFGGAVDRTGRAMTGETIAGYGILRSLTPGGSRYVVGMPSSSAPDGFAPVLTKAGRPLVIDMATMP